VTGETIAKAYDRLEVVEFMSRSLLELPSLDRAVRLTDDQLADLDSHFPD